MVESRIAQSDDKQIRRDIFQIIWPVTAENILQMLMGFVNTAMVGRLGAATILAVGMSGRLAMFAWIIFGAVGTGVTVLVAQALGAGDQEGTRAIARQGLILAAAFTVIVVASLHFLAPSLLLLLKTTPEALALAVPYLRILVWSMPFQAFFLVVGATLRGQGDTRTPMQIALAINSVTVVCNSVLIFGRFGLPELGFRGPAVGTIIGQAVGAALAFRHLFGSGSAVGLRIGDRLAPKKIVAKRVLAIGLPASTEMLFWQIAAVIIFRLINDFGTAAGAAYQLGLQAEGISYMPSVGFGIAATALVGRCLGGGNPVLAERYIRQLVRWGVTLSTITSAILLFGSRFLMGILTDDPEVIAIGAGYLFLMAFSQVPQQISGSLGGSLRGAGDTVTPMISAAVGVWVFRVPLAFLLSARYGLPGVWWAVNIDQFSRFFVVGFRYLSGNWKVRVKAGQVAQR